MKLELQISLDFLHLENALFCAEQSISGGGQFLELGNTFIKNNGLNSIRIFREKFPDITISADIKTMTPKSQELKAIAAVKANAITISGAISKENWKECIAQAKKYELKTYLDFREFPISIIRKQIDLIQQADCVLFDLSKDVNSLLVIMQEIAYRFQTPIGIQNLDGQNSLEEIIALGPFQLHSPI